MAALELLPAELFGLIANQIKSTGVPLVPLAATSKHCQSLVELLLFSGLKLQDSDVPEFSRFVNSNRFKTLRELDYYINRRDCLYTDTYGYRSTAPGTLRVSSTVLESYSTLFSSAIEALLVTLDGKSRGTEPADVPHPGTHLCIGGDCFPAARYLGLYENSGPQAKIPWVELRLNPHRFTIPTVTSFTNQWIYNELCDKVSPQSWSQLLSFFPNLKKVVLRAYDNERKALRSRIDARDAFGQSLTFWPSAVTDVDLEYLSYAPANHACVAPRLTDPMLGYDVFSHQLGLLSQRLVKLSLRTTVVDYIDFFKCSSPGMWLHLRSLLFADMQESSADGSWYFNLDPRMTMEEWEEDSSDTQAYTFDDMGEFMQEDELPAPFDHPTQHFRTATDPAKFEEIYLVAAEAVKGMPKLRTMNVLFDLQGLSAWGRGVHEFWYSRANDDPSIYPATTADISVGWILVPPVPIDEDVLRAWKGVAAAKELRWIYS